LPKSAEYLGELRRTFGNLGLAAAAYNAGPRRVHDWLSGTGGLPAETRDYVLAITGRTADEWRSGREAAGAADKTPQDCPAVVASLKAAPTGFAAALEHRIADGAAKPWGVELLAGFSRERIMHAYAAIAAKYAEALAGTDALILRDTFRSRGTRAFYQVRAGADTRRDADRICTRLRAAGAACLVLRNLRGTPEAIGTTGALNAGSAP
jgi:SPOR domain/Transglycosylase SLT domain